MEKCINVFASTCIAVLLLLTMSASDAFAQASGTVRVVPESPTASTPFMIEIRGDSCLFNIVTMGTYAPQVTQGGNSIAVTIHYTHAVNALLQCVGAQDSWVQVALGPLPAGDYDIHLNALGSRLEIDATSDLDNPDEQLTSTTSFLVGQASSSKATGIPTLSSVGWLALFGITAWLGIQRLRHSGLG